MSVDRRTFLRLAASGLSSALVPLLGCVVPVGNVRETTHWPTPDEPLTPREAWYFFAIQEAAQADLASYRLDVGGLVREPLSLSVQQLQEELPRQEQRTTLACVGNPPGGRLMSAGLFAGAPVRALLDRVVVSSRVTTAVVTGLDGYATVVALEVLRDPSSLLAYELGTDPDDLDVLPIDNGFPLRLLLPGHYGQIQPKWIDSITFVDAPEQEILGEAINAIGNEIQLASGFSSPRNGWTVDPGEVEVLGFAFGDGRRIIGVEVAVDDGPWREAELAFNGPDTEEPTTLWTLWRWRWPAEPGPHALRCRATYEDGQTQSETREFPYSGGSIARIDVEVRAG